MKKKVCNNCKNILAGQRCHSSYTMAKYIPIGI